MNDKITARISSLLLLLLMLVLGGGNAWADEPKDFDLPNGYYFLGNEANANSIPKYDGSNFAANFYMCPAYHTTREIILMEMKISLL